MKKTIFIAFLLIGFASHSQKTEFGITLEGGFPLVSNQKEMIQKLNEDSYAPFSSHLVHPNTLWNVEHLTFDIYPKPLPNTSISIGLRMFNWGWEIDTISVAYYDPSDPAYGGGWKQLFARREYTRGYLLPTLSLKHSFKLSNCVSIQPFVSVGPFGIGKKFKRASFSFSPDKQDFFDYYDYNTHNFSFDVEVFDFQAGGVIKFDFEGFFATLGVSYYHFRDNFYGRRLYNGLHLNGGLGYRFSRRAK